MSKDYRCPRCEATLTWPLQAPMVDEARFRRPVVPGDQLRFELEMVKIRGPLCRMKGTA